MNDEGNESIEVDDICCAHSWSITGSGKQISAHDCFFYDSVDLLRNGDHRKGEKKK